VTEQRNERNPDQEESLEDEDILGYESNDDDRMPEEEEEEEKQKLAQESYTALK
jgi:hypothetical protein